MVEHLDKKIETSKHQDQPAKVASKPPQTVFNQGPGKLGLDGIREEPPQSAIVSAATHSNFDVKNFELECKKIVQEISDRLLDLGLDDDNNSDYQNLMQKQEKFAKEFEKLASFQFDSHGLRLPRGRAENEEIIEEEDASVQELHARLGADMDKIHEVLVKCIKHQIQNEGQIIQVN